MNVKDIDTSKELTEAERQVRGGSGNFGYIGGPVLATNGGDSLFSPDTNVQDHVGSLEDRQRARLARHADQVRSDPRQDRAARASKTRTRQRGLFILGFPGSFLDHRSLAGTPRSAHPSSDRPAKEL
jgi:hypothetical protein